MAEQQNPTVQERLRALAPDALEALVEIARTANKTTRFKALNALRKHLGMFRNKKSSDLSADEREKLLQAATQQAKKLRQPRSD